MFCEYKIHTIFWSFIAKCKLFHWHFILIKEWILFWICWVKWNMLLIYQFISIPLMWLIENLKFHLWLTLYFCWTVLGRVSGIGEPKINCRTCFCSRNSLDFREGDAWSQFWRNFSEIFTWSFGLFFLSAYLSFQLYRPSQIFL